VNQWRRYADDGVLGFEHRKEAEATRRITTSGEARGKPETFDFLGFTHICGKTRKGAW
jgi:hypothetical protein